MDRVAAIEMIWTGTIVYLLVSVTIQKIFFMFDWRIVFGEIKGAISIALISTLMLAAP